MATLTDIESKCVPSSLIEIRQLQERLVAIIREQDTDSHPQIGGVLILNGGIPVSVMRMNTALEGDTSHTCVAVDLSDVQQDQDERISRCNAAWLRAGGWLLLGGLIAHWMRE